MSAARTVTFELSEDYVSLIDRGVAEGMYGDDSAVIESALASKLVDHLMGEPPELEINDDDLLEALGPALDRLDQGRSHLLSSEEVGDRLEAAFTARGGSS